ncbi:MAG: hypothetical protein WC750_02025 [Patescibacteria group bacterium]|jgi:hypothetical protein
MATRTKTRTKTNTKTIAIAATVLGLAAAAGLGYNMYKGNNFSANTSNTSNLTAVPSSDASSNSCNEKQVSDCQTIYNKLVREVSPSDAKKAQDECLAKCQPSTTPTNNCTEKQVSDCQTIYKQYLEKDPASAQKAKDTCLAKCQPAQGGITAPTAGNGTLLIQNLQTPASTIVVAGKDVWVPFATYNLTGGNEDMTVDRIAVSSLPGGDNADFTKIAIASGGTVRGASFVPSGQTGSVDIDTSSNKITVPKGGTVQFQIWAMLSPVVASAVVNGSWTGVARSGHMPALGLASNLQTGVWSSYYANKLNIKAVGVKTNVLYLANAGSFNGNPQVMRKSKPIVTKMNLATNTLSNGDMPLYNWSVGADSAGPIAIKQIMLRIDTSPNVKLLSFKLYRGSTLMSTQDYSIIDARTGINLVSSPSAVVDTVMVPTISFTNEQVVSGGNTQYSLHATISYVGTGNTVTTSFYRGLSDSIVTGTLTNKSDGQFNSTSPLIYNIASPSQTILGTFVWSDNSELPHNSTVSGSADWTNHTFVNDLAQITVLSN